MNFTKDAFISAQKSGKTVVVNSWNKWCGTCISQEKVFKKARKDFKDVVFLSYAQKNKDVAKFLNIDQVLHSTPHQKKGVALVHLLSLGKEIPDQKDLVRPLFPPLKFAADFHRKPMESKC